MSRPDRYPSARDEAALRGLPFEHALIYENRRNEGLIRRLELERHLVDDGLLVRPDGSPWRIGALIVDADSMDRRLREQVRALELQSHPVAAMALLPSPDTPPTLLATWAARVSPGIEVLDEDPLAWMDAAGLDTVIVLAPGTLPHPGLATALARALQRGEGAFAVWNHILLRAQGEAGSEGVVYLRCPDPAHQPIALAHMEAAGPAWAAPPTALRRAAADLGLANPFSGKGRHLLTMLMVRAGASTARLNEFLGAARDAEPAGAPWPTRSPALDICRRVLTDDLFTVEVDADHPVLPVRLSPRRRPESIDVVINFRDRAEMTLRAMDSVYAQRTSARITLFLVDNRSDPAEREKVAAGMARTPAGMTTRLLSHDRPFNHSAQCSMAADAGDGEAVVFMSNDCTLEGESTLETLAAWALVPGVGTVGPRLEGSDGRLTCSGICALYPEQDLFPIVAEGFDHLAAGLIRETFANTFACAALARETYAAAGPLDAVNFPVGLNDVEYCLRLRRRGLSHLYLGTLCARHQALGSRPATDDGAQQAYLRQVYGDLLFSKEYMLEFDFLRQMEALEQKTAWKRGKDSSAGSPDPIQMMGETPKDR